MKKLSAKETQKRIDLYTKKNLSLNQIATRVGVSATSVYWSLKRAGVAMRPVGRPAKASN